MKFFQIGSLCVFGAGIVCLFALMSIFGGCGRHYDYPSSVGYGYQDPKIISGPARWSQWLGEEHLRAAALPRDRGTLFRRLPWHDERRRK